MKLDRERRPRRNFLITSISVIFGMTYLLVIVEKIVTSEPSVKKHIMIEKQLFKPLLSLPPLEVEKQIGPISMHGLQLPPFEFIIKQSLSREVTGELLEETMKWVYRVLRPKWLVEDLRNHFFALQKAIGGHDAFVGAWSSNNRIFQIVVTRTYLHLLTSVQPFEGNDAEKLEKTLTFADELFQFPKKLEPNNWWIKSFNGFWKGAPRIGIYDKDWYETLFFLTDGNGIKFSIKKQMFASNGPPKSESSPLEIRPWFKQTR